MCAVVSAGVLLRKEHASSSARTVGCMSAIGLLVFDSFVGGGRRCTSQPVDGPLLELLERDLGGGGDVVEA